LYDRGLGTGKDPARAFAIYSDLAMKGSDDAQRHLAGMYERGEGVSKDLVIACAWYKVLAIPKSATPALKTVDEASGCCIRTDDNVINH